MSDLQALSDAAADGPWAFDEEDDEIVAEGGRYVVASGFDGLDPDAAFIVALVNAYRAGDLVPAADLSEAVRLLDDAREVVGVGHDHHPMKRCAPCVMRSRIDHFLPRVSAPEPSAEAPDA